MLVDSWTFPMVVAHDEHTLGFAGPAFSGPSIGLPQQMQILPFIRLDSNSRDQLAQPVPTSFWWTSCIWRFKFRSPVFSRRQA